MNGFSVGSPQENKKLDIIADLVEAKAKTVAEAVEIIRNCKVEAK